MFQLVFNVLWPPKKKVPLKCTWTEMKQKRMKFGNNGTEMSKYWRLKENLAQNRKFKSPYMDGSVEISEMPQTNCRHDAGTCSQVGNVINTSHLISMNLIPKTSIIWKFCCYYCFNLDQIFSSERKKNLPLVQLWETWRENPLHVLHF